MNSEGNPATSLPTSCGVGGDGEALVMRVLAGRVRCSGGGKLRPERRRDLLRSPRQGTQRSRGLVSSLYNLGAVHALDAFNMEDCTRG